MRLTVLYFAAVRELAGCDREALDLTEQCTVRRLAERLEDAHERLRGRLGSVRFAVNEEFVDRDQLLCEGDVVAIIPPVAGGSGVAAATSRVAVSTEPLSLDFVAGLVRHPGAGALAIFVGAVRDRSDGREVTGLEYSAYESMALAEMARVIAEIEAQIPGTRLAAHHRIGPLEIGDDAIICAASAPHRDEAFRAGRLLIDRIKERVPVWKREEGPGGVAWVGWEDARTGGEKT